MSTGDSDKLPSKFPDCSDSKYTCEKLPEKLQRYAPTKGNKEKKEEKERKEKKREKKREKREKNKGGERKRKIKDKNRGEK